MSKTIFQGFILASAVALAVTTGAAGLRAQDAPDQSGVKAPVHHMETPNAGAMPKHKHKKAKMGKMPAGGKAPVHHMEPPAQ